MRAVLLALLALVAGATAALADERISNFVSDATVNADASLTVRETITYEFRDIGPKRGIFRDVPTRYRTDRGIASSVGFDVLSVKREGRDEPFALEPISNGIRIRIGEADVFLPDGAHDYEIVYRTSRQLGFFDGFDELYWNVTGSSWAFPIDRAEAIVRLPPAARILQHQAYTGPEGAALKNFRVIEAEASRYRAVTTRPLEPGEGFTVAVGFTKGAIAAPSDADRIGWFLADNAGLLALAAGVLAVAAYYVFAWLKVGRDPPGGTIIPLFRPPEGLGPAGARYVWRQSFDDKAFASAVVGLAVKNKAKIYDEDGGYAVEKLDKPGPPLTPSERALVAAMKPGRQALKQSNYITIRAMRGALQAALDKEFDGVAFLRNTAWFWGGLILSVLAIAGAALLLPGEEAVLGLFMSLWTGGWWAGILTALIAVVKGFGGRGIVGKLGSAMSLLFLIPFIVAGVAGPVLVAFGAESPALFGLLAAAIVLGLMNMLFLRLLRAPTLAGRKLLDGIEGFRMYLATAEEERLNVLHPPEKTPELYERYLPYALALNCENEWSEKFAAVLAAAGIAAPAWYHGGNWSAADMGGFTRSVGASLAAATSSSYSPPGSSSGSSGGGSSGGGGGGGGGGSW